MLLPCDPSSTFLDSTFDRLASMYPREDQKGSVWARWPISISRKDADVFAKLAPFQEEREREGKGGDESRRSVARVGSLRHPQRRRDGRSRRLKVWTVVRVIGSIEVDRENSDREFRPLAAFCAPFLCFFPRLGDRGVGAEELR